MFEKDTIAAIATGLTDSGIGIIRISGPGAVEVGDGLFRLPGGRYFLKDAASHVMQYGFAVDKNRNMEIEEDSATNGYDIIDEVMAVVMRGPRSFTGEDTVEIQCHGGVYVMQRILETALKCGARLAEPGEFTKRAFLNGRMDLSQAEAVMDVIRSQNQYALSSSVNQLKGALSEKIKELRGEIIYEIAFIESALDDPEHISLEGYQEKLYGKVEQLLHHIGRLIDTAYDGKLAKEGINTVIVGKPNVGKSSLLNRLIGQERAIVTNVAGTTRDVLTESIRLGDIHLNIVDTAGIRSTEDYVEKIGVDKAKKYADEADLILYVVDASADLDENDREIADFIKNKKRIVLLNKSDLEVRVKEEEMISLFAGNEIQHTKNQEEIFQENHCKRDTIQKENFYIIRTSAKEGEGMDVLEQTVKSMFFHGEIKSSSEVFITNMRHKENLQEAYDSLLLVKKSIEDEMPEDFFSIDLMNAYGALGRIIGEEVEDDLVEEIFSKFCMGN